MLREYPSTSDEAFKVAITWSYYKKWINIVYKENRLCDVPYEKNLDVHLWLDIWWAWWGDDMAVWFFQIYWKAEPPETGKRPRDNEEVQVETGALDREIIEAGRRETVDRQDRH